MSLDDDLLAYANACKESSCVWGETDCSSMPARFVETRTGKRVPLPTYRTRGEAARLIAKAGSLEALWGDALAEIGIFPAASPEPGSVAIIDTEDHGEVGAVIAHGGIAICVAEAGVKMIRPRQYRAIWNI